MLANGGAILFDVAAESRITASAVFVPSSALSSIFEIVSNTMSLPLGVAFNAASSHALVSAKALSIDANACQSSLLRNLFRPFLRIFAAGLCPFELSDVPVLSFGLVTVTFWTMSHSQNAREIVC